MYKNYKYNFCKIKSKNGKMSANFSIIRQLEADFSNSKISK